jgi:hypothetical protein
MGVATMESFPGTGPRTTALCALADDACSRLRDRTRAATRCGHTGRVVTGAACEGAVRGSGASSGARFAAVRGASTWDARLALHAELGDGALKRAAHARWDAAGHGTCLDVRASKLSVAAKVSTRCGERCRPSRAPYDRGKGACWQAAGSSEQLALRYRIATQPRYAAAWAIVARFAPRLLHRAAWARVSAGPTACDAALAGAERDARDITHAPGFRGRSCIERRGVGGSGIERRRHPACGKRLADTTWDHLA